MVKLVIDGNGDKGAGSADTPHRLSSAADQTGRPTLYLVTFPQPLFSPFCPETALIVFF